MVIKSENSKKLDSLMTGKLGRFLKEQGFVRKGRKFLQQKGELTFLITFQPDKVITADELPFRVFAEIVLPLWHQVLTGSEMPKNIASAVPIYSASLGELKGDRPNLGWAIEAAANLDQIAREILALAQDFVLPLFGLIQAPNDLAAHLESQGLQIGYVQLKLAALCAAGGDRAGALQHMQKERAGVRPEWYSISETIELLCHRLEAHLPAPGAVA